MYNILSISRANMFMMPCYEKMVGLDTLCDQVHDIHFLKWYLEHGLESFDWYVQKVSQFYDIFFHFS